MIRTRLISNVKIYLPIGGSSPRFPSANVMESLNCGILNVQASSRKLALVHELQRFIKYDVFRLQGVRIDRVCGAILISNWVVFLRLTKLYFHRFWITPHRVEGLTDHSCGVTSAQPGRRQCGIANCPISGQVRGLQFPRSGLFLEWMGSPLLLIGMRIRN